MRLLIRMVTVAALAVAPLASSLPAAGQRTGLPVKAIDSPAGPNSSDPQLSVSSRGPLLSWIEQAGARATLKFAERTSSGWTPSQTVASGEDWFVNWADVPSVTRLDSGALAAHWLQKRGPGSYDVRLSHSTDDGRTWAASVVPHDDLGRGEHGFASLLQMPGAGLGLVWLDGRTNPMSLRSAAFDSAWQQTTESVVDGRVCDCCPTAAAVTADGPIVAYRDRSDTEVRDIYVSRLERGVWTAPVPVFKDEWQINACPVNGPAIAARGRDVVVAWFTGKEPGGRAFLAFSHDSGRTFGAPIRLDDAGTLGRVGVVFVDNGVAAASWIDYQDKRAEIRVRYVTSKGRAVATTVAAFTSDRSSGFPRLAVDRGGLLLAWTESTRAPAGAVRLRVLTARVEPIGLEPR